RSTGAPYVQFSFESPSASIAGDVVAQVGPPVSLHSSALDIDLHGLSITSEADLVAGPGGTSGVLANGTARVGVANIGQIAGSLTLTQGGGLSTGSTAL